IRMRLGNSRAPVLSGWSRGAALMEEGMDVFLCSTSAVRSAEDRMSASGRGGRNCAGRVETPGLFLKGLTRARSGGAYSRHLGDDLQRPQSFGMVVDVGDDDDFICSGLGDQCLQTLTYRLGPADDGIGEHGHDLRLLEIGRAHV